MSFHRPFLLFLVIALTSLTGAAQSPEPAPENGSPPASAAQSPASPAASGAPSLEKTLLPDLLKEQKAILFSPKQLKNADTYKFFVPFLAGTAALLATDRRTSEGISDSRDIRNVSRNISYAGTAYSTHTPERPIRRSAFPADSIFSARRPTSRICATPEF